MRNSERVLTHQLKVGSIVNMIDNDFQPILLHERIKGMRNVGGDIVVSLILENDMLWERIIPAKDLYTQLWEVVV